MPSRIVSFILNGREVEVMVKPMTTLQDVLRKQLGFSATKSGCKQGSCGSCTVLVNGEPMVACLLPVEDVAGEAVTTLEGITPMGEALHPLQEVFAEGYAAQCGYCTPGMILTTKALLDHNPSPTREEIAEAIAGNYCRCTGYKAILDAIEAAAEQGG